MMGTKSTVQFVPARPSLKVANSTDKGGVGHHPPVKGPGPPAAVLASPRRGHPWVTGTVVHRSRPFLARTATPTPEMTGDEVAEDGLSCLPAFVTVDPAEDGTCSVIHVSIVDYPGLLRSVSWVLNGLGLKVVKAKINTTENGMADNWFWVTTNDGQPLDDAKHAISDRLMEFVQFCMPTEEILCSKEFCRKCGNLCIKVDNSSEEGTVVTVEGFDRSGFLLELASIIEGLGFSMRNAEIEGGDSVDDPRIFKLTLVGPDGGVLDYQQSQALMFTMELVVSKVSPPGLS
eukprot:scaffold1129_cov376-Prasinococcus_capsulatus_cf.AAC.15